MKTVRKFALLLVFLLTGVSRSQDAPRFEGKGNLVLPTALTNSATAFYQAGGIQLLAQCESPVYYLAGEARTEFNQFLKLDYAEQGRPASNAIGIAGSNKKTAVTLDSGNRDLLSIELDPTRGIGLAFKKPGNVNLLVTFAQGSFKLPLEVVELPIRLGDSKERVTKLLGEPDEKSPIQLRKGQNLTVDRIVYSNATEPAVLEHWRFRKYPGLVVVIQANKLVEIGTSTPRPGPRRIQAPQINAKEAGLAAIKEYDANKNGFIDGEELNQAASIKSSLEKIDRNSDKRISAEEVEARINAWKESRIGIMSLSCRVNLDGKPLEGATVTFIPEAFLGENVKLAKGTTGPGGAAMLTVNDPELAAKRITGGQCGLYAVEIEAPGKNLPPRYNRETTLGIEVAQDAPWVNTGLVFELESK